VNGCTTVSGAEVHTRDLPIPVMKISPQKTLCLNADLKLEGGGGVGYEWRLPNDFVYRGKEVRPIVLIWRAFIHSL
jgi:hypothetical protein